MIYGTDKIKIINCSKDKYGKLTEIENDEIDARIKDTNKMVTNENGEDVIANSVIMIDKNNVVNYGDKIIITERFGRAYEKPDKKFIIKRIESIGGFTEEFLRISI